MQSNQQIHDVHEDAINPALAEFDRQLLRQRVTNSRQAVRSRAREIVRTTRNYLSRPEPLKQRPLKLTWRA